MRVLRPVLRRCFVVVSPGMCPCPSISRRWECRGRLGCRATVGARTHRRRRNRAALLGAVVICLGTPAANRIVEWAGDLAGHRSPVLPAPLFDTIRPDPSLDEAASPMTPAAERVLATLGRIDGRLQRTRYQHRTRVREGSGDYFWDCSGMVNWVLRRASPRALSQLGRERPVAMNYARVIARSPTTGPRRGWQRIEHVGDVRPGDVFAWESPARFRQYATGHVGFVVSSPAQVRGNLWALRIVDSTIGPHQDDTRPWDDVGGSGRGTMTFQTDSGGDVVGYGWWGTESPAYVSGHVVFGRVR